MKIALDFDRFLRAVLPSRARPEPFWNPLRIR